MSPSVLAQAAVVSVGPYEEPPGTPREESCAVRCDQSTLWVRAPAGERNLVVVVLNGGEVVVSDGGARLTAGPGCVESLGQGVRCSRAPGFVVDTADGDDRITSLELPGLYRGGQGSDVVVGLGSVVGGDGDDVVTALGNDWTHATSGFGARAVGGSGRDVVSAIDGLRPVGLDMVPGDVLLLGGPDDDTIVAGSGATIALGGDGNDRIRGGSGQSWIYGGQGNDDLRGSDYVKGDGGDDTIHGTRGADRLRGGPGRDFISGGAGRDDIRSDAGVDRIRAVDHERDRIDCGGEPDHLIADRIDLQRRCRRA